MGFFLDKAVAVFKVGFTVLKRKLPIYYIILFIYRINNLLITLYPLFLNFYLKCFTKL